MRGAESWIFNEFKINSRDRLMLRDRAAQCNRINTIKVYAKDKRGAINKSTWETSLADGSNEACVKF
jgi:hypothetical protein